jgi:2-polyprenyl-3-methyl-5-hydroxy-6-metoxy-1,4-benzoquinol methylase
MQINIKRIIKDLILKMVFNKLMAKLFLRLFLRIHSFTYNFSGRYAGILNSGVHPKHSIMKYKEWFVSKIDSNWVILDIGSNTGMLPFRMSQKAKFIYGIEIESRLVKLANKNNYSDNIKYLCADVVDFDFSILNSIDCITMSNVLEHIDERVEFLKILINNVKWTGSKFFLIRVPMLDRDWISVYKKEIGLEFRLDHTHFTEYTFSSFKKELDNAGIKIKDYHIRFGEIYAECEC